MESLSDVLNEKVAKADSPPELIRSGRSGRVNSWSVYMLQTHHRMGEFCTNWDKDIVRLSAPPCIMVWIKEDKVKEFEEWVLSILPDARIHIW
jgi:hypothetical protein